MNAGDGLRPLRHAWTMRRDPPQAEGNDAERGREAEAGIEDARADADQAAAGDDHQDDDEQHGDDRQREYQGGAGQPQIGLAETGEDEAQSRGYCTRFHRSPRRARIGSRIECLVQAGAPPAPNFS